MSRRLVIWGGGILAVILIIIFVLAYLIDEPLRRKSERDMNARLKGYTVRVEKLDFHPIGLSLLTRIHPSPTYPIYTPAFTGKRSFLDDWLAIFKSKIPKSILTFDSSSRNPRTQRPFRTKAGRTPWKRLIHLRSTGSPFATATLRT